MKYLCIGGHHDGKRVELADPRPRIVLPIYPKREHSRYDEPVDDLETELYVALPFEANGGRFIVYAIDGMSAYQALEALIEGYSTKQPEPMKLKYQSEYDAINNRRTP